MSAYKGAHVLVDLKTRTICASENESVLYTVNVKYRDIVTYFNMLVITGMNELLYSYVEITSKLSLLWYCIVLLGYPSNQTARVE
jgi:hypothetical protein